MSSSKDTGSKTTGASNGVSAKGKAGGGEQALQFLVDLKLLNDLPPIPFDPKFLRIKTKRDRFYTYKRSSLEQSYQYKVHVVPSLGPSVHLIDPSSAAVKGVALSKEDRLLLRADDETEASTLTTHRRVDIPTSQNPTLNFLRRAEKARAGKSWLLKTQYLENNLRQSVHNYSSGTDEVLRRRREFLAKQEQWLKDTKKTTKRERVLSSFKVANDENSDQPVHSTKPHLKPVKVFRLLPADAIWANEYYQVSFTDSLSDLTEGELIRSKLAQISQDSQAVAHIIPQRKSEVSALETTSSADPVLFEDDKYKTARDYSFNVRTFKEKERVALLWDCEEAQAKGTTKIGTCRFIPIEENAIELKRNADVYETPQERKRARLQTFFTKTRDLTSEERDAQQTKLQKYEEGESDDEDDEESEASEDEKATGNSKGKSDSDDESKGASKGKQQDEKVEVSSTSSSSDSDSE